MAFGWTSHAGGEIAARHQLRVFDGHFQIAAERAADAAQHHQHHRRGDGAERHRDREPAQQVRVERALHVVHVHAGDEIPVPWCKVGRVAGLRHRLFAAGLGPQIVDETAAVAIARVDHIDEQMIAERVGELRDVLAVQLGLDRVHQDDRLRIVDGDIAVLAVAHARQQVERLLFGVVFGERVLLGQRVITADDVIGLVDQRDQLGAAVRDHRRTVLPCAEAADQDQANPEDRDHRGEFFVQSHSGGDGFRKEVGQSGFARSSWLPANCVYGASGFIPQAGETRCFDGVIRLIYQVLHALYRDFSIRFMRCLSDCLLPGFILTAAASRCGSQILGGGSIIRTSLNKCGDWKFAHAPTFKCRPAVFEVADPCLS